MPPIPSSFPGSSTSMSTTSGIVATSELKQVRVELTNLEAHRSKLSLVLKGYRNDIHLRSFGQVNSSSLRSGSIDQGYLMRAIALEATFEREVIRQEMSGERYQVLSLGAGYDTTFFRLRNCGILTERCAYFEVDLPKVTSTKAEVILSSPIFNSAFPEVFRVKRHSDGVSCRMENFALVGCDLTRPDDLWRILRDLGLDSNLHTIVLSECVLTYVEEKDVSSLLRKLILCLKSYHIMIYGQIHPNDSFGKVMRRHFSKCKTPLKNLVHFPTLADQKRHLAYLGCDLVRSRGLMDFMKRYFGSTELEARSRIDPAFDEFEEIILKCQHYSVWEGKSSANCDPTGFEKYLTSDPEEAEVDLQTSAFTLSWAPEELRRTGACACSVNDKTYMIGGYSPTSGRDGLVLVLDSDLKILQRSTMKDRICFGACAVIGDDIYVFGGRQSPDEPSNRLLKIDSRTLEQELVKIKGGLCPSKRWKHSMVSYNDELIMSGGRNASEFFNDLWSFSTKHKTWTLLGQLPTPLFSHSSVVDKHSVTVTGGLTDTGEFNNELITYDMKEEILITKAMTGLRPRFAHTSHVLRGQLILVGGVGQTHELGFSVVDLRTEIVENYAFKVDTSTILTNYNHSSILTKEDKILILGGGGNCFSFGMHVSHHVLAINL